jgi:hypothetical protein
MRRILTGVVAGVALLVAFGCGTNKKARRSVEQPVKPPIGVLEDYDKRMSELANERAKRSQEYLGECNKGLNGYEAGINAIREETREYEILKEAVERAKREIEERRKQREADPSDDPSL